MNIFNSSVTKLKQKTPCSPKPLKKRTFSLPCVGRDKKAATKNIRGIVSIDEEESDEEQQLSSPRYQLSTDSLN